MAFDIIGSALQRKATLDDAIPASGNVVKITAGTRNPFKGSVLDEDGEEHTAQCALLVPQNMLGTEFALHKQWVGGWDKREAEGARQQFVLTGTIYLPDAKLLICGENAKDETLDVEYPMPERVEGQMLSISFQKFAANEEAAMEFGNYLKNEVGLETPATLEKRDDAHIERVWTYAVPVPNEVNMRRPAVIAQRIERALKHGPFVTEAEVGENYKDGEGYKNFLFNLTQSFALAELMADDEDAPRKAAAGTLISSLTGRKEGAVREVDGKPRVPVYPERADVGRITLAGHETFDFWTSTTPATVEAK